MAGSSCSTGIKGSIGCTGSEGCTGSKGSCRLLPWGHNQSYLLGGVDGSVILLVPIAIYFIVAYLRKG